MLVRCIKKKRKKGYSLNIVLKVEPRNIEISMKNMNISNINR